MVKANGGELMMRLLHQQKRTQPKLRPSKGNLSDRLSGIEFHDQLLIDEHIDFFTLRSTIDGARVLVAINGHPIRNSDTLSKINEAVDQLLGTGRVFHSDHVTGLADEAGDVHRTTVHSHVTVSDHLAGSEAGVREAHAIDDIVQALFEHLKKKGAGHALATGGLFEITAELLLHQSVGEAELLLLSKSGAVVGHLATRVACTVLTRGEVAGFERLGRAEQSHAEATGDFFTRTSVASHILK